MILTPGGFIVDIFQRPTNRDGSESQSYFWKCLKTCVHLSIILILPRLCFTKRSKCRKRQSLEVIFFTSKPPRRPKPTWIIRKYAKLNIYKKKICIMLYIYCMRPQKLSFMQEFDGTRSVQLTAVHSSWYFYQSWILELTLTKTNI